jgi:hypothetical protein
MKPMTVEVQYLMPPLEPGTAEYVGTSNLRSAVQKTRRVRVVEYPWWWHTLALVGAWQVIAAVLTLVDATF